jgi:hypothetical protein
MEMEITPTARYPAEPLHDTATIMEQLSSGLLSTNEVCKDLSVEDIHRVLFVLAYKIRIINNYAMADGHDKRSSAILSKESNKLVGIMGELIENAQNKMLQRKDRIFQLIDLLEPAKPEYIVAQLQTELKLL